jgi:hypothetical protein
LDEPGRDELAQRGLRDSDVASDSDEANAPLGDEPTREAFGGPELVGGFRYRK